MPPQGTSSPVPSSGSASVNPTPVFHAPVASVSAPVDPQLLAAVSDAVKSASAAVSASTLQVPSAPAQASYSNVQMPSLVSNVIVKYQTKQGPKQKTIILLPGTFSVSPSRFSYRSLFLSRSSVQGMTGEQVIQTIAPKTWTEYELRTPSGAILPLHVPVQSLYTVVDVVLEMHRREPEDLV
jgi:hypothetical protein